MIIVVYGLPGTGKSTVANYVAKKINATILRTDVIRKRILQKPAYTDEEKDMIYKKMFDLAEDLIKKGANCILDAAFTKEKWRDEAVAIAKKHNVTIILAECVSDQKEIEKRIGFNRRIYSDADYKIYLKLKEEFEPTKHEHVTLDTTHDSREAAEDLLKKLK
jgi:predicted kinase